MAAAEIVVRRRSPVSELSRLQNPAMMQEQLHVIEASPDDQPEQQEPEVQPRDVSSAYDAADEVDLRAYASYSFPRFITAVLDRTGKPFEAEDLLLVDELPASKDVNFGLLLAGPDESLVFVGSDPTAKDSIPWFAFVIDPMEPMPAPETAQDALDLLKPPRVRDVIHEDDWIPNRHGEWWLLPTACVPAGTVFQPGVASKPYGPSPLGNHVPREYAFTVSDSEFMQKFSNEVDAAPNSIETPPEAIDWLYRQMQKSVPPEIPDWHEIRTWAGDILVRGTVRHRDNDHFVENLGEVWHRAETHDVEVYTGDQVATDIHLDYHGG